MATLFTRNASHNAWVETYWNKTTFLCQGDVQPRVGLKGIFANPSYIIDSTKTLCLFQFSLIMLVISSIAFLLKPFGFTILSQMAAGIMVMGLLFPNNPASSYVLLPGPVLYILKTLSYFGLSLYTFMLGVETNMGLIRKIGKKSITICLCGTGSSLLLSVVCCTVLGKQYNDYVEDGTWRLILLQSQCMFGVICLNVNDLGISNSELGRLALTIALLIDVFSMFSTFLVFNFIIAIIAGDFLQPMYVLGDYLFLFFVLRPIIIYIIGYTPPGGRMSQTHFTGLVFVIIIATMTGSLVDQKLSIFLFGLSIPQEPLSSILADKLDAITSGFYFPIFCAIHGYQANFGLVIEEFGKTAVLEAVLITGYIGKFLGIMYSSMLFSVPWRSAVSLGIIISSKGFFDIIVTFNWSEIQMITIKAYTVTCLHIIITTFAFLPLVRKLYEPSKNYSTIFRQNVASSSQIGALRTLACIYNEENVAGILHFLEALHPSRSNPVPVVTVQLIQSTGRCSLPIMAVWEQVKSYALLKSDIARGDRIVSAFTNLERKFKGHVRMEHYVSVSSYATMHNDICNLAYQKNISLLIVPFHVEWTAEGFIKHSSQSIRDVNKMVFEKAPCTVATFVNRGHRDLIQLQPQLHLPNPDVYRVTIFFIGGPNDEEALAFCKFFANHPFITLTLIWLNSSQTKNKKSKDYLLIEKTVMENDRRINFKEVVCNDGAETTNVLVSFKDEVDLAVVGKHHDPDCRPLFGLDTEWNEYPEMGIFADLLLAPDFNFSVLVVQQEPQHDLPIFDD